MEIVKEFIRSTGYCPGQRIKMEDKDKIKKDYCIDILLTNYFNTTENKREIIPSAIQGEAEQSIFQVQDVFPLSLSHWDKHFRQGKPQVHCRVYEREVVTLQHRESFVVRMMFRLLL